MKKVLSNKIVLLSFRLVIGFIFIFAGIEKISNPESFAISIENYRVLPIFLINLVAITLPWIEVIVGVLLIFGISIKENIAVINTLLILFIFLIALAVFRGLDIDCGCFGTADGQKVGILKILENTGLFILGIFIYLFEDDFKSIKLK
jgi:putative oxidoreductase